MIMDAGGLDTFANVVGLACMLMEPVMCCCSCCCYTPRIRTHHWDWAVKVVKIKMCCLDCMRDSPCLSILLFACLPASQPLPTYSHNHTCAQSEHSPLESHQSYAYAAS